MKQKITTILTLASMLLVGCVSNPPTNQKLSDESPLKAKSTRIPTNISDSTITCVDDFNTGFEVIFQKTSDEASTVELKNINLLTPDTKLTNQFYPVKYQVQTSPSGESSLKFATFYAADSKSDSFFLQIATHQRDEINSIKPGKFSLRNTIGQTKNASLICCSEKLKPTKNEQLWSCQ